MNLDSGNMASTFLTFCGFVKRFGSIALTASLSSVQTEFSLRSVISSVIGSEVPSPQIVPREQVDDEGVDDGGVDDEEVDSEFVDEVDENVSVVSEEVSVAQSVIPLHLL